MIDHSSTAIQALLLSPPFSTLTYLWPAGFTVQSALPGLRLAVPLGKSIRPAILLGGSRDLPKGVTLKEVIWPLEHTPLLPLSYLDFARQLALRQMQPLGRTLASMLPAGLRETSVRLRFFQPPETRRFEPETKILDLPLAELGRLPPEDRLRLAQIWQTGQGMVLQVRNSAEEEIYQIQVSPPWPVRPAALRQIRLLDFLENQRKASRGQILAALGAETLPALKLLLKRGLVGVRRKEARLEEDKTKEEWLRIYTSLLRSPPPFALNPAQQAALAGCLDPARRTEAHLIYGVTGSGKTAVYLELAAQVLLEGRGVLLLAPELALAAKLKEDAERRFPGLPVHLFHSDQSPAKREACFRELAQCTSPYCVVGARSALFLPLKNVGAIILDEEHDASFKQDERFLYNAKELAWFLADREKAPLILGSATPDLKTFHAAVQGRITMHRLEQRAGGGVLPEITLDLLPRRAVSLGGGILTDSSSSALKKCVKAGDQAVILLNRRGFAPCMYCLSCGHTFRCPNCEISLTYHKGREKLLCHYCGYSTDFPQPCPECRSLDYLPMGEGTEKLEEYLNSTLPVGTRVLRLDRDSTARPGTSEEILRAFAQGQAQVLVGTQMLSKGHHFPQVTLSIVADGDLGLSMLEYNAAERVFQLILQAAGRAGRGEKTGQVIIQTRDPAHYCWRHILNNDYPGFYQEELERRRLHLYPPFCRLALIRLSCPKDWGGVSRILSSLSEHLRQEGAARGVTVLGPAPAPRPLREKRLQFQCLLKGQDWNSLRALYVVALASLPPSSPCRVSLDLDPAG